MWRSLFWKEWREQRWKAAFNTLLVTAFVAVGLRTRISEDYNILMFAWTFAATILPMFISIGLITAERGEGTACFLQVLPARIDQVVSVKIIIGLTVILLPFLCSVLVAILIAGNRESSLSEFSQLALNYSWLAVQTLLWFLALTVQQPDEAHAGVAGLGIVVIMYVFYSLLSLFAKLQQTYWLMLLPLGYSVFIGPSVPSQRYLIVACQILILIGLVSVILRYMCKRAEVRR